MIGYIVLGISLGLPLLLGLGWRVSAPHIFFSVMAGEIISRSFAQEMRELIHFVTRSNALAAYAEVVLFILPLIVTAIFLRNSLKRSKAPLHMVPLVITGLVLAAFMLPVLPESIKAEVQSIPVGAELLKLNHLIVGGVVLTQLFALWLFNKKDHGEGSGKHFKPGKNH